ncbi:thioesterase-like superfamily-domain-containing protein [Fusarium acuminatum]|uniref:Thioesterase-like superfamily-domain-containing protein n=1 Tax=Fusarium acuminatum TaxID=5515 RepID=A0ABZ2WU02_9HYPO
MGQTFEQEIIPQQTGISSYTVLPPESWAMGPALHGGCVAAVIHSIALNYLTTALAKYNQPDVLTLHVEYLRYCTTQTLDIDVIELKRGSSHCTIQLQVSQEKQLKAIGLITSTNFAQTLGPTSDTQWALNPPPASIPDFDKLLSNKPDPKWVPGLTKGEVFPMGQRIISLCERGGMQVDGLVDAWNGFPGEKMQAPHISLMCDFMPSMADTLLRSGGMYDGRSNLRKMEAWAEKNPGVVCELETSLSEAAGAKFSENTVSLDIEFKKRLPEYGLQWIFSRVVTKKLHGGRMDMDITICDESMDLVCLSKQVVLVLDAKKRYQHISKKANL